LAHPPLGRRIRQSREACGLTQSGLARRVGISASYLNLIEHDRRSAQPGLMRRLAQAMGIDPSTLSGAEESRLQAELTEASADPVLAESGFDPGEAEHLVSTAPRSARALLAMYRQYRAMAQQVDELAERVDQNPVLADLSHQILSTITSIRSFAEILHDYADLDAAQRARFLGAIAGQSEALTRAAQEMFDALGERNARSPLASYDTDVEDFFADNANHFPALETAADALSAALPSRSLNLTALEERLARQHGIALAFAAPDELPAGGQVFTVNARRLTLSQSLPLSSVRLRLAELLAGLEAREAVDEVLAKASFAGADSRERARRALVRYVAAAVVMPYDAVYDAAEATAYDIARLQQRFGASFEQICQRLTSLQRPGRAGLPFHFVRSDIAGNLSKRFSASGLRLPRFSAACPRWVLHEAFLTPDRLRTQVAEMPDGTRYLFLAQARVRAAGGYATPPHQTAVMLGCDLTYARRTVYAARAGEAPVTPVGTTCRQCPRADCAQRVAPAAVSAEAPATEPAARPRAT